MRILSCLFACLALSLPLAGQTPDEILTTTTEFEFDAHVIHQSAGWETSITSFNGSIYAVFLDSNLKITAVRKDPLGTVTSQIVDSFSALADLHHTVSIGVDEAGYIHVIGNQHNLPSNEQPGDPHAGNRWRYWRSVNPENVSSWEFVADTDSRSIPATVVEQPSYVRFYKSSTGTLFATFRGNAGWQPVAGWQPGKYAAYLARYTPATQSWSLVGGPSGISTTRDVMAYELAGAEGGGYQPIQPAMYCSANGRLHYVTAINSDNSVYPGGTGSLDGYRSATHVFYAQSDDDGATWHKADGTPITLPMTTANADVVAATTPGKFFNNVQVGETSTGEPFVMFIDDSVRQWKFWNGAAWEGPVAFPNTKNAVSVDQAGVISWLDNNLITRSYDNGVSTKSYAVTNMDDSSDIDRYWSAYNASVRLLAYSSGTPVKARGLTLGFTEIPPSPPPANTERIYLEAELGTITSPMTTYLSTWASNGAYAEVLPGNTVTSPPANGIISIDFTNAYAANYIIWGRVNGPTTSDDSFFVRVDGGSWASWNSFAGSGWHWDDVHNGGSTAPAVVYSLGIGTHTVQIAYREDGAAIDKLLVTNDQAFVPSGWGDPAQNLPFNAAPVAVNESYTLAQDTVLNVAAPGVLSNDTDADLDPLSVDLGSVTAAGNGTVNMAANGSFTYTPNAGFSGTDSFTYQATDGALNSTSATVNLTVNAASQWTQIIYDDFEGGYGNWVDGGSDSSLYSGGTFAHQGSKAIDLQDNTSTSVMTTSNLSLSGYTQIQVEFWYYTVSMDNSNEDFWLQISTNGGNSYTTVATWALNADFQNNQFYSDTVVISGYTLNNQTRIRFRCDASDNDDDVYIDEVRVSAK